MTLEMLKSLIGAEENGMLVAMLAIFCYYFYQQYTDAQRPGLRRIAMMQMVTAGWLMMLYVLDWFVYYEPILAIYKRFSIVSLSFNLFVAPLCFVTQTLLTKRRPYAPGWVHAHVVPFALAMLVGFFTNSPWVYYSFIALTMVYGMFFLTLTIRAAVRYNRAAVNEYSSLEGRSFRWMIVLPFLLGLLLPAYAIYCYTRNVSWLHLYQFVSLILWWLYFSRTLRMVRDRNMVAEDLDELDQEMLSDDEAIARAATAADEAALAASDKQPIAKEPFVDRLRKVCEENELYLREDLTREDVARAMHTNHTYLSRHLQQEMGTNFYTYINTLRVARAKELITQHPDWTMERIAVECGYRSRNSLSSAFQRIEGIAPLDWRQREAIE